MIPSGSNVGQGVLLAQGVSLAVAFLAVLSIAFLKSARLRSWCACRIRELYERQYDGCRYDELDDLRYRVAQLESQMDQLTAGLRDSEDPAADVSAWAPPGGRSSR